MLYQTTPALAPTGGSYNDGTSVYGSPEITFDTISYDTADWSLDQDTTTKEQTNRFGVPVRAFGLPVTPTGTCNVILPSESATLPPPGEICTFENTGMTQWIVTKVGLPYKKDDFLIMSISFRQALNQGESS